MDGSLNNEFYETPVAPFLPETSDLSQSILEASSSLRFMSSLQIFAKSLGLHSSPSRLCKQCQSLRGSNSPSRQRQPWRLGQSLDL